MTSGGDSEPAGRPALTRERPFPGLTAFGEEAADYFHGRATETAGLFRLIERGVLTVLFGRSGLGKTSLVQAGLLPLLREHRYFPVPIRLRFGTGELGPIEQIKAAIATAAAQHDIEAPAAVEGETLWEYLHRATMWDAKNHPVTPVLILDQFEEIFTLGAGNPEVRALLVALEEAVENRIPPAVRRRIEIDRETLPFSFTRQSFKVLLSLREDFLPELEALRERVPSIMENRFRLTRMNGDCALEAVLGSGGHLVDRETGNAIVRFAAAAAESAGDAVGPGHDADPSSLQVEPALLALVCFELNERRLRRRADRIFPDLLAGAKLEILEDFYERSMRDLPPAVRVLVEERLLTASGYRSTVALEDALQMPGVTEDALARLVDGRFLRREVRLGQTHLELMHDVLAPVILASRDRRREQEERRRFDAEREIHARRMRVITAIAAGFALLAVVAGWAFWRAQAARADAEGAEAVAKRMQAEATSSAEAANKALEQTREALERAETAEAEATASARAEAKARREADRLRADAVAARARAEGALEDAKRNRSQSDYHQAMLKKEQQGFPAALALLAHAVRADPTNDKAAEAIIGLLSQRHWLRQSAPVRELLFHHDGKRFLAGLADGSAQWWDMDSGLPEGDPVTLNPGVTALALSPDGRLLAVAGADRNVRLRDAVSGEPSGEPLRHSQRINGMSFSSDGRLLVVAAGGWRDDHGYAQVWDVGSGDPVGPRLNHLNRVVHAGFSPDGSKVATASWDWTARIWNVADGRPLSAPLRHEGWVIHAAFFNVDGKKGETAVTTSSDGTTRLWEADTGAPRGQPGAALPSQSRVISADAITTTGGRTLLITASAGRAGRSGYAHVLDVGRLLETAPDPESEEDETAATGGSPLSPEIIDARLELPLPPDSVRFTPDAKRVLVAAGPMIYALEVQVEPGARERRPGDPAAFDTIASQTGVALSTLPKEVRRALAERLAVAAEEDAGLRLLEDGSLEGSFEKRALQVPPAVLPKLKVPIADLIERAQYDPPAPKDLATKFLDDYSYRRVGHLLRIGREQRGRDDHRNAFVSFLAASVFAIEWMDLRRGDWQPLQRLATAYFEIAREIEFIFPGLADWYFDRAQWIYRELAERLASDPAARAMASGYYNTSSWYYLFQREPAQAVAAAKRGLELDPENKMIYMNMAHGYLLLGDPDRARQIYTDSAEVEITGGGRTRPFAAWVLDDFEELRAAGIDSPHMEEIERLLEPWRGR